MRQNKTKYLTSFLHSTAITAAAVVILVASLGAMLLPNIFADTSSAYPAPKMTVRMTNPGTYTATMTWSGTTPYGWEYTYGYGNVAVGGNHFVSGATKAATFSGLKCNEKYGFRIYASDKSNHHVSPNTDFYLTPSCPAVSLTAVTVSGDSVIASWKDTAGFDTGYTLYMKAGSGGYVAHTTSAKSLSIGGSCATTYSAYVVASASGQSSTATPVRSTTTAACPAPAPAPVPVAPPAAVKTLPKKPIVKKTSTPPAAATTATPAPAMPANFAAEVQSDKLVELNWDAVTGNIDHYIVNRSTDNATWTLLTSTKATSYEDSSADFSTTYYYQLQAIGSDGQASGFATAQAATNAFTSSSGTVVSDDKAASVTIPAGAVDQSYNCTLSTDQSSLVNVPLGQRVLLGPYDLLCIGGDGNVVTSFKKPIAVTLKATSAAKGYANLSARTSSDQGWDVIKSAKYNAKTQQLSFTLTSSKTFAAFGQKKKNIAGPIISIFVILLLIAGGMVGFIFWRRNRGTPEHAAIVVSEQTAEQEFKQALAAPDCSHKALAQPVNPSSQGCYECQQNHTQWKALRICLICGHVGCSDDSDEQHALKHFQQTGHPIVYDYADPNGNSIGWCYVDQTYI